MLPLILLYSQEALGLTCTVVTRHTFEVLIWKKGELEQLEKKRDILMDKAQVI